MSINETIGLEITAEKISLYHAGAEVSAPTPAGAVQEGIVIDVQAVAKSLKTLLKENAISAASVIAAVSGKHVVVRLSTVPALGPDEIKDILNKEASQYIVFAGSAVVSDFCTVEEVAGRETRQLKVLAVTAKKELIDSYIETVKQAGLILEAIDVGQLALARAISARESLVSGIAIVSAVTDESATILVTKDGKIYYVHAVEALGELNSELDAVEQFCRTEFAEQGAIKRIISSEIPDISVARGIVLRDAENTLPLTVNLLPLEEVRFKEVNAWALQTLRVTALLIAGMTGLFLILEVGRFVATGVAVAMQHKLERRDPRLEGLLNLEKMHRVYVQETQEEQRLLRYDDMENWGAILEEIKKRIPVSVYLSAIASDKEYAVTFKGVAADQNAVFQFVNSLKTSPFFSDISLKESKAKDMRGDAVNIYFEITSQLRER